MGCVAAVGDTLITGSWDCTTIVWSRSQPWEQIHLLDAHCGTVHCLLPLTGPAELTATSGHDRQLLATGSRDCTVQVWDLSLGEQAVCLRGHEGEIESIAETSDGLIVSGSRDGTARIWKVSGLCICTLRAHSDW